jgi:hypothetical protein
MARLATPRDLEPLIAELQRLYRRPRGSPTTDERRRQVEQHLVELLASRLPHHERRDYLRVPCHIWSRVRTVPGMPRPGKPLEQPQSCRGRRRA